MSTTLVFVVLALAALAVTGVCWRYVLKQANHVRRGEYGEDELDDDVEVSGF